ncbi:MAG: outer membrane beta-barrel protein [Pseudomonadota bacterium]
MAIPANKTSRGIAAILIPVLSTLYSAVSWSDGESVLTRQRPELEPLGFRSGAFIVYPSLEAGLRTNDNLFSTDSDKVSDTATVISPSLNVVSDWNNHSLQLGLDLEIARYADESDEDYEDYTLSVSGRTDITRREQIFTALEFARKHEERDSVDDSNSDSPIIFSETAISANYVRIFNRIKLDAGVELVNLDYDDGRVSGLTINNDDRDRSEFEISARADYEIASEYAGFAELTLNQRNYDSRTDDSGFRRDSNGYEIRVGSGFQLSGISSASVYGGYISQSPDESSFSDISGASLGGNLIWDVTSLSSLQFTLERDVLETTLDSGGALSTRLGARVDHELLRNLLLFASYDVYSNEYEDISRDDDDKIFSLGVNYLLNRALYVNIELRRDSRDSSGDDSGEDFSRQQLALSARLNW